MKRWMTALAAVLTVAFVSLGATGAALASTSPDDIMDNATSVLNKFVTIPENRIPAALLHQAYGIAVIPSVLKASFIGGAQYGQGVLSVRTRDGDWSNPTFIKLYGGSFGFQAGVSSTDLILVFKTRRSVQRLAGGEFKLGADASVAAGPVGRHAGASTNVHLDAEVYSYSRSRGLFAGVALNGARLHIAKDSNWEYYNQAGIKAATLLGRSDDSKLRQSGKRFVYTLNRYMPSSNDHFHYKSNTEGGGSGDDSSHTKSASAAQSQGQTAPYGSGGQGRVTVQQSGHSDADGGQEGQKGPDNSGDSGRDYGDQSYGSRSD